LTNLSTILGSCHAIVTLGNIIMLRTTEEQRKRKVTDPEQGGT